MTELALRDPLKGSLSGSLQKLGAVTAPMSAAASITGDTAPRPEEWEIKIHGSSPAWLQVLVSDINRSARLPANWDSYDAERLQKKAALHSIELLQRLDFRGPAPWVSPTKDGGVHLEWTLSGFGLEIEVSDAGDVTVVVEDHDGVDEWRTSVLGDERLVAALGRVSAHR